MEYIRYECDGDKRLALVGRIFLDEDEGEWFEDVFRGPVLEGTESLDQDAVGWLYKADVGECWCVDLDEELATAGTEVATGTIEPGRHWFKVDGE